MRGPETGLGLFLMLSSPATAQMNVAETTTTSETRTAAEETTTFYAAEPILREYIAEALVANPSVQQSLAEYRAALQRVPQVEALPEPMLSYTQAIESVETRVGPQRNAFTLSQ